MKTLTATSAPKPTNILQYVATLESAPEKVIDDLTWLAAQLCCTPMALVCLLDERRAQIKSKVGLTARETARGFGFGDAVISLGRQIIVTDALQDLSLARDPWVVSAPNARFLAGVPLIASNGRALGALSVMDRVPRQLGREQVYALEVLARQIVSHLEWRTAGGKA